MVKRLKLDDLLPEAAVVELDGMEHPIVAQSVEAFLQFMKRRGQLEEAAEATDATPVLIEQNIELILIAVPSIPKERLMRLPFRALMSLVEFIGEEMTGGMTVTSEEGETKGEATEGEAAAETAE